MPACTQRDRRAQRGKTGNAGEVPKVACEEKIHLKMLRKFCDDLERDCKAKIRGM